MALSLDGNTSFIGTEFIKLLNTGSSDLATEEYVLEQVALGGGSGDGYTQAEVDALLNNKLNVNNPQDILGTLRIDSTNGNGKLIVNAVGAPNDEDFYVNGLSNLGGTLKCQLLQASSNIETSQLIRSDTLNSYSNTDMKIQRNSIDYIVLESDKVNFKRDIYVNDVLLTGGGSGNPFDENVVINDPYELQCNTFNNNGLNQDVVFNINSGEWLRLQFSDNTVRVPNTKSFLSQNIFTDIVNPLTFSNDVVFNGGNSTNDAYEEHMRLDASTEKVNISKEVKFENTIQLNQSQSIRWTNVYIREVQGATRPEFDLIINGSTSHMRMWVAGNIKQAITDSNIAFKVLVDAEQGITVFNGQQLRTNIVNSNGNNNLVFQRNNVEYLRFDTTGDNIICSKQLRANGNILVNNLQINQFAVGVEYADFRLENADSVMRFYVGNSTNVNFQITHTGITLNRETTISSVKTNTIDTTNDSDLSFRRNGVEFFNFLSSVGVDNNDIINVAEAKGISAQHVYGNLFKSRSLGFDTIFYGSNTGATARVEYMRYNYAGESLDFNCPIDNTGLLITGNIVDTTVSDERLKTNIEDVECNFTECVKNVKVKTFEYTDEKYKHNDKYGFIAQQLQENLPKEFNHIVKENKEKNSDDKYLSINYMKVNLLLWGALQEEMAKTEYLESKLFETIARVEALEKPKAKSKAKAKAKNVD